MHPQLDCLEADHFVVGPGPLDPKKNERGIETSSTSIRSECIQVCSSTCIRIVLFIGLVPHRQKDNVLFMKM